MKQTHRWDGLIVAFLTAQAQVVTITEFGAGITAGAGLGGITSGPDGNLWFTEQLGDRPVPLGWAYPAGRARTGGPTGDIRSNSRATLLASHISAFWPSE